ncbi:MAG TPA: P-loop NTPase [bacterium]|nr:P-loop NTPase [bacterium]
MPAPSDEAAPGVPGTVSSSASTPMSAPMGEGSLGSVSETVESLAAPLASRRQIWAVGGGKGGIGKSLITANMGIILAQLGKRVVLIDADLGGANLHTTLGVPSPRATLGEFIQRKIENLEDIVTETPIPNLGLISGAYDFLGAANPKHAQKIRLLRKIQSLDYDFVLLDLGAGTAFNTLDFFLTAEQGILAVLPEPTSIENAYRFIKTAFYRRLKMLEPHFGIREMIQLAMDQQSAKNVRTPSDLLEEIRKVEPEKGERLIREMRRFRPKLIVNQVRAGGDAAIGNQIATAVRKYFGIDMEYIGHLEYDDAVWRSVRRRRPLLLEFPSSKLHRSFGQIVDRLLGSAETGPLAGEDPHAEPSNPGSPVPPVRPEGKT